MVDCDEVVDCPGIGHCYIPKLSCLSLLKQLTIPCLVLFCDDVVDLYLELIAHLVVEQMCFYTVCIQPREPQQPDCDGTNFSRFRKKILLCSG